MITEDRVPLGQALELRPLGIDEQPPLSHLAHPVQAYLNSLAPSSRRPQLSALDWIARRSTQVFSAETMPWQRLLRPHVLKIRSLLEENYLPATANLLSGQDAHHCQTGQLLFPSIRLSLRIRGGGLRGVSAHRRRRLA